MLGKGHAKKSLDYRFSDFKSFYNLIDVSNKNEENKHSLGIFPVARPRRDLHELTYKCVDNAMVTAFMDDRGMINHHIYFTIQDLEQTDSMVRPSVGSRVNVRACRKREDGLWTACSITYPKKSDVDDVIWDDDAKFHSPTSHEEKGFFMGVVTDYNDEDKIWKISDGLMFSADDIIDEHYQPYTNDWIKSKVDKGGKVSKVEPLRKMSVVGTITRSAREGDYYGTVNDDVYFHLSACENIAVRHRDLVNAHCVETNFRHFSWRAYGFDLLQRGGVRKASNQAGDASADNQGSGDKQCWVYHGERPEYKNKRARIPSFLPEFPVSKNLKERVRTGGNIFALQPSLKDELCAENYVSRFSAMLQLAEINEEMEVNAMTICNAKLEPAGEGFVTIRIPGIANNHPPVEMGDVIKLTGPTIQGQDHRGFVHEVLKTEEKIYVSFHGKLIEKIKPQDRFTINFSYSRIPFRRCHFAVRRCFKQHKSLLFPRPSANRSAPKEDPGDLHTYDERLNKRQRLAVHRMQAAGNANHPYVLYGPPGTGKSVTLTELIVQLVKKNRHCRLLVCAPSNNAVDTLCVKLHETGQLDPSVFTRFNSFRRPRQLMTEPMLSYCRDSDDIYTTVRYQVIFTTCVNAGSLFDCRLASDHFTHVIIDEAAQCTEPESLVPIALAPTGRVVLAGDPMQLGSVVKCALAKHFKLDVSFLERLVITHDMYRRDDAAYSGGYNADLVTKLTDNYRSHPSLLRLPSQLFYHDELVPKADRALVDSIIGWKRLPNPQIPLVFHAVCGQEKRDEGSPSFFNPAEVIAASHYARQLVCELPQVVHQSDIAIITPYRKQVHWLRSMLKEFNLPDITIGSVEAFQGQERKVIILSLVRSTETPASSTATTSGKTGRNDPLSFLGFVADPKRFNVSVTRARALLVVLGNPNVLKLDPHWAAFMDYCKRLGAYKHA